MDGTTEKPVIQDEIFLGNYEEVVGVFSGLFENDGFISVLVCGKLVLLPCEMTDDELVRKLQKVPLGSRISLFKLDDSIFLR